MRKTAFFPLFLSVFEQLAEELETKSWRWRAEAKGRKETRRKQWWSFFLPLFQRLVWFNVISCFYVLETFWQHFPNTTEQVCGTVETSRVRLGWRKEQRSRWVKPCCFQDPWVWARRLLCTPAPRSSASRWGFTINYLLGLKLIVANHCGLFFF